MHCCYDRVLCKFTPTDQNLAWIGSVLSKLDEFQATFGPSRIDPGPVLYLWLRYVLASESRRYICNVFSHWLWTCPAIEKELAQLLPIMVYFGRYRWTQYATCHEQDSWNIWHAAPAGIVMTYACQERDDSFTGRNGHDFCENIQRLGCRIHDFSFRLTCLLDNYIRITYDKSTDHRGIHTVYWFLRLFSETEFFPKIRLVSVGFGVSHGRIDF